MSCLKRKLSIILSLIVFVIAVLIQPGFAAKKSWIGVYMQDVTEELTEAFELGVEYGVLVNDVIEDSPAAEAGLKQGDVLIAWGGKKLTDSDMLVELVGDSRVGENIELIIVRKGDERKLTVEIGERRMPSFYGHSSPDPLIFHSFEESTYNGIGVSLQSLSGDLGEYFGVPGGDGVLITEIFEDSPAEKAGLKVGDVIMVVAGEDVESPGDVSSLIRDMNEGDTVELSIVRDRSERQITVEVDEIESYGIPGLKSFHFFEKNFRLPQIFMYDDDESWENDKFEKQMRKLERQMKQMERKLKTLEDKLD